VTFSMSRRLIFLDIECSLRDGYCV
jgi:hypothetical protein